MGSAKSAVKEAKRIAEEAKAQVKLMKDMINADASDDTLKAFLEASQAARVLKQWRILVLHEEEDWCWGITGEYQAGAVIKELQGVYVHSILSGPKTVVEPCLVHSMGNIGLISDVRCFVHWRYDISKHVAAFMDSLKHPRSIRCP